MGNIIFIISTLFLAAVSFYLDYASTVKFTALGHREANPRYKLPDGKANLPKILREKFIAFAACLIVCGALYFSGLNFAPFPRSVAFALFLAVALRHFIVARSNYRKIKRIGDLNKFKV